MTPITRRQFAAASAAALSAASYTRAGQKPSDRVVLAVMGLRNRGKQLIQAFSQVPGVEVGCVIDPDANQVPAALDLLKSKERPEPKVEKDVRKALEDKGVTALVVAAPDHWHALATVWGCQAGKHVYVEKPATHNLAEGRRMIEAARKYDRVVHVGTQRRSGKHLAEAREFVRSGGLGKVPYAKTSIAGKRPDIGKKADAAVPPGVDYDLWLGPAPQRPFNPNHFHYEWHWFWEYGTNELGNNGVHGLDVIRALLDLDAPRRVTAGGGQYFFADDKQTPDTMTAAFEFEKCLVVWEHRTWAKTTPETKGGWKVVLEGEKGTLEFGDKGWKVVDGVEASGPGSEFLVAHVTNFRDAVRGDAKSNCDIEEGVKSARLCHLGNIAFRTGGAVAFDPATETVSGGPAADRLLGRTYRAPFALPEKV